MLLELDFALEQFVVNQLSNCNKYIRRRRKCVGIFHVIWLFCYVFIWEFQMHIIVIVLLFWLPRKWEIRGTRSTYALDESLY